MTPPEFHGLIQHSFSFRLSKERQPLADTDSLQQIEGLFALTDKGGAAFDVKAVGKYRPTDKQRAEGIAEHSPLVRSKNTTVHPLPLKFSKADGGGRDPALPPAFEWAGRGKLTDPFQDGPTFVFGKVNRWTGKDECNDFLVERSGCPSQARWISWSLLEVLAHKRSRLLGLELANRIVSVMLPHAILTPTEESEANEVRSDPSRSWFVQPLLSFIRDGQMKTEFRDSCSLTLLLVPITACDYGERTMSDEEIDLTVNAGWGLAAVPTHKEPPQFQARGPLLDYLPRFAAPVDPATLLWPPEPDSTSGTGVKSGSFTLRQGTEVLAFCLARKLSQGPTGHLDEETTRRIGDEVVTSLGSARVSSVLAVDDQLTVEDILTGNLIDLPRHRALMETIARETRPPAFPAGFRQYRLDRAFVDDETNVVGVVPTRRCIVVSCAAEAQRGWYQSGLLHAGSITHMTIGAAAAIGTLCAIDRDLERMEEVKPSEIADIDGEIATDLREIYDLDITSEAYRRLYRLLRKRLGIIRDYEALEEKMMALYRATSTKHEIKTQKRLKDLTFGILALTAVLIIIEVVHLFI